MHIARQLGPASAQCNQHPHHSYPCHSLCLPRARRLCNDKMHRVDGLLFVVHHDERLIHLCSQRDHHVAPRQCLHNCHLSCERNATLQDSCHTEIVTTLL